LITLVSAMTAVYSASSCQSLGCMSQRCGATRPKSATGVTLSNHETFSVSWTTSLPFLRVAVVSSGGAASSEKLPSIMMRIDSHAAAMSLAGSFESGGARNFILAHIVVRNQSSSGVFWPFMHGEPIAPDIPGT
jgi:hypothetical protein